MLSADQREIDHHATHPPDIFKACFFTNNCFVQKGLFKVTLAGFSIYLGYRLAVNYGGLYKCPAECVPVAH